MSAQKAIYEIHALEAIIEELRQSVHDDIGDFKTYAELYSFMKSNTRTREEFNLRMGRLRVTFLDRVKL